jgi:tetratricopeptide (TPR) repeat protein
MKVLIFGILVSVLVLDAQAQSADADVARCMGLIKSGQADAAKAEVPALLAKYPNNPGVIYLQGLTTQDGAQAVRVYQSVVDNFPKSEWADDALFKVYQFYHSLGLYRTAQMKMEQLRKDYPNSPFIRVGAVALNLPDEQSQTAKGADTLEAPRRDIYTLQVGAFTTAANAQRQKSMFEDLAYPVEVITKVKEGRSLYLVQVGSFESAEEARAAVADIRRQRNIDAIVTTK